MATPSNPFDGIEFLLIPTRYTDEDIPVAPDMNEVVLKINEMLRALKGTTENLKPIVGLSVNSLTFEIGSTAIATATPQDVDGQIKSLEFTQNGNSLGVITQAPWRWVWTPPLGEYDIVAIATDDKGASTASTAVRIKVSNPTGPTQPTLYGASYDTTPEDYTEKCGSGTGLSQSATVPATYATQALADAAAKKAAIDKIVCTVLGSFEVNLANGQLDGPTGTLHTTDGVSGAIVRYNRPATTSTSDTSAMDTNVLFNGAQIGLLNTLAYLNGTVFYYDMNSKRYKSAFTNGDAVLTFYSNL